MSHAPAPSHIVDQLIEERAVRLRAGPAWPLVRAVIYPMLGYERAVAVADQLAGRSGREAMDWSEAFLNMPVSAEGAHHVPETGPCVITVNHPGGIADGIAVWSALKARRPDMVFFANRDAIRVCGGLSDMVIPVEWRGQARSRDKTRETLRQSVAAFREGRCVVIFPAGRMADWSWSQRRLVEPAWSATGVSIARRFNAPIVPMGVTQHMPLAYYVLSHIHEELRDVTLFHGLINQRGAKYRLSFGEPVTARDLPGNEGEATQALKERCEALAWG